MKKEDFESKREFLEVVKMFIAEVQDIEIKDIKDDSELRYDLSVNSLNGYELVYKAEEELEITIPDDTVNQWGNDRVTVVEIADYLWDKYIPTQMGE